MRTKNQETLDRILKFVNKYYQEHHSSPTINDVAEGVGVARSTTHRYLQELSDRNLIDYSRGILSAPQSAKMKTAYVSAPLVGSIRCGNPEDEEESIEEYVSLPVSMFGKGDFYILRAKGRNRRGRSACYRTQLPCSRRGYSRCAGRGQPEYAEAICRLRRGQRVLHLRIRKRGSIPWQNNKGAELSGTRCCSARNQITLNNNLDSMGDVLF